MGSSKTAQALMTRFNFIERGKNVWLIKPEEDVRDGETIVRSRIGLEAEVTVVPKTSNIIEEFNILQKTNPVDVIIADEAQFFTAAQAEQLRDIADNGPPVMCYGLRGNFQSHFFAGSLRLFELADTISEIKTICSCGNKAIVNARITNGKVVTDGPEILMGGNESYISMCHKCWKEAVAKGDVNNSAIE